jgi:siroheme synthase
MHSLVPEAAEGVRLQVAVVKAAGTAEQHTWRANLSSVVEVTSGSKLSPCIIVVGQVAGL